MSSFSTPRWAPTSAADLLALVADLNNPTRGAEAAWFLASCHADAENHNWIVSVNRVRMLLAAGGLDIEPRRLSSFWSAYTGLGRPMVKSGTWEICDGSPSGNDGRPLPLRLWVGWPASDIPATPEPAEDDA